MISGYQERGKSYFLYGNRRRASLNTISKHTRQLIVDLHHTKYHDCNFAHFTELFAQNENIKISEFSVRMILETNYILSSRVTKAKRKRIKKELKAMKSKAGSKKKRIKSRPILLPWKIHIPDVPAVLSLVNLSRWMLLHISGLGVK